MHSDFFQELKARGLIFQVTDEAALEKQLNEESVKLALIQQQTVCILVIYYRF